MSRVSAEMAPDARREPRRIAHAYSQGEQRRSRSHIVETRTGSALPGGRSLARVGSTTRRSRLRASHPAKPLRGHDGFSIRLLDGPAQHVVAFSGAAGGNPAAGAAVVHPAHASRRAARQPRAALGRCARAPARLSRARPALLVHPGAALRRRRHRLVRGHRDGRRRRERCSASTPSPTRCSPTPPSISAAACCAFRCGSRRRRSPCCCSCARRSCCSSGSSAARRCRSWTYVVPPVVGALLWPVISVVLQWPQRPRRSSEL